MKKIAIAAMLLIASTNITTAQVKAKCMGITKSGQACSRNAKAGQLYCFQHNPSSFRCGITTKAGQPCKMVVKAAGEKCYHHKAK